jgi:hypothetical protein
MKATNAAKHFLRDGKHQQPRRNVRIAAAMRVRNTIVSASFR